MQVGKSKVGDMDGNAASALCYIISIFVPFIPGIIYLVLDNENPYIKFNAIQSIVLMGLAYLLVCTVVAPIACLVFMIMAAIASNKGELYKAPVIGKLCAEWSKLPENEI